MDKNFHYGLPFLSKKGYCSYIGLILCGVKGGSKMDNYTIEARKTYSKLVKQSRQNAKQKECLWCNKTITRFCNSHSVPEFVLKNISLNGEVDFFNAITKIPLLDDDKGVGEAGTFHLICKECDGIIFQDYENPNNLVVEPTEKMLRQIALKNILLYLDKRFYEIELYKTLEATYSKPFPYQAKEEVNDLDVRDFLWDYHRIKDLIENDNKEEKFKMIFWKKLPYKVPMAFQGPITILGDLKGNIVENIYDKSEEKIIRHLHICVFPLNTESVVFAFYHIDDCQYDNFAKQLQELPNDELVDLIAYIIFQNSEDMLISKKIPHKTFFYKKIEEVFSETTEIYSYTLDGVELQMKQKLMALKNRRKDMPKILSKKYAVKENIERES